MRKRIIGKRYSSVQVFRYVLWEDRLEQVASMLFATEVTRLFFDELTSATVHRHRPLVWITIWSLAFLTAAGSIALLYLFPSRTFEPVMAFCATAGLVVAVVSLPVALTRDRMVVHAPGQSFDFNLPLLPGRREAAIRRFIDAVEQHQAEPQEAPRSERASETLTGR